MEQVISDYLESLDIPISTDYCKQAMLEHSDYPSLLSVVDVLDRLGVDYKVGQVEKEHLSELPLPCVLHLDKGGGEFVIAERKSDLETDGLDLEHWDGVVLKAEATDSITDEAHNEQFANEKRQKNITAVLGIALLGIIALPVIQAMSWLYLSLFATTIAGSVLGYLLVAKDLGVTYKPVENFCKVGKKTNCDRILNSEEANILGVFTFSDAVLSYFCFQLLVVVFTIYEKSSSFLWVLSAASILTIPIIGYSLYYQGIKAQVWCRLCIAVDIILGLQAGLFVTIFIQEYPTLKNAQPLLVLVSMLFFTAISAAILLFKNRLETAVESGRAETLAKRVKYDPDIFVQLLFEEKKIDVIRDSYEREICIGDTEAPIEILLAASFGCRGCQEALENALRVIKTHSQEVYLRIRFLPFKAEGEVPTATKDGFIIAYWLQYIQGKEDETERTERLIRDWYKMNNLKKFRKKYNENLDKGSVKNAEKIVQRNYNWFMKENIRRTPLLFVNNYKLPESYKIEDLIRLIPGILDLMQGSEKEETEELV